MHQLKSLLFQVLLSIYLEAISDLILSINLKIETGHKSSQDLSLTPTVSASISLSPTINI